MWDMSSQTICNLPTATLVSPGRSINVKFTTAEVWNFQKSPKQKQISQEKIFEREKIPTYDTACYAQSIENNRKKTQHVSPMHHFSNVLGINLPPKC